MTVDVPTIDAADRMPSIPGAAAGTTAKGEDRPTGMDYAHYVIVLMGITGLYLGLGTALYGMSRIDRTEGLIQLSVGIGAALVSILVSRWAAGRIGRLNRRSAR